jgi:hypothetical protein
MKSVLSRQAKHEFLQLIAPQYTQASSFQKKRLLEEFVATTGYVRKYAM